MEHREKIVSHLAEKEMEGFLRGAFAAFSDEESDGNKGFEDVLNAQAGELLNQFHTEKSVREVRNRLRELFDRNGARAERENFTDEARRLVEALDLHLRA